MVSRDGTARAKLGFVIPARDEETFIADTIASIHRCVGDAWRYEVVVVDNGSSDATATIAREGGAEVVDGAGLTIAGLRNAGAAAIDADLLVCLDADMVLQPGWAVELSDLMEQGHLDDSIVGGATRAPPESGWVANTWLNASTGGQSFVGSAHLLIPRWMFEQLGGFDAERVTGEDTDLCDRARREGFCVKLRESLGAVHRGVPAGLREFMKRELWHGTIHGSWTEWLRTQMGIAVVAFGLLHLILLATLLVPVTRPLGSVLAASTIAACCATLSYRMLHRFHPLRLIRCTVLSYLRLWARVAATLLQSVGGLIEARGPQTGRHRQARIRRPRRSRDELREQRHDS